MKPKISVYCHDAGGTVILAAIIAAYKDRIDFEIICLEGAPGISALHKQGIKPIILQRDLDCLKSIEKAMKLFGPDLFLYTTGWQNNLEEQVMCLAAAKGIPTAAFLDSWTDYKQRFGYPDSDWKNRLPTYIVCHDKESEKAAYADGLENIICVRNYALKQQLEAITSMQKQIKQQDILLFLSEPTQKVAYTKYQDSLYWGFSEKDVYDAIVTHFEKFECEKLVVRPHPAQRLERCGDEISNCSLEEDIARAKVVIGIDSSVLYTAFFAGKFSIAFIPSYKRKFHIPLPPQNRFRSLQEFKLSQVAKNSHGVLDYGIRFDTFVKNVLER